MKLGLSFGIIFLFLVSWVSPVAVGYMKEIEAGEWMGLAFVTSSGPMDSAWPIKCHDNRHTGRSPYSTADNPGIEKWRFKGYTLASPVIGDDCTIYIGDTNYYLYALNPDGTEKWKYKTGGQITSAPSLDEDGTIYVGSWDTRLYAFRPDGECKWYLGSGGSISSSPSIAEDGTIYFGTFGGFNHGGYIVAVNPNGTEKWRYETGDNINTGITSDPAIGDDGTIYIGSMDTYFYAMNPNGTLKWRFKTGDCIKGPPSIADDGTVYIGSFDDYLYALYPNGTLKWKCDIWYGTDTNPSIAIDGTIYVCSSSKLFAIYPNGTKKWTYDFPSERHIGKSSQAISADGTIYIGTNKGDGAGGDIIAVNPDGTERWRKVIADYWVDSSPCIGEDGTVYIGSTYDQGRGYLHAFGKVESNVPPETPTVSGESNGKVGESYWYSITAVDSDRNPISFYIDWGDGDEGWQSERASGEKCYYEHSWLTIGNYTIRVKAKDVMGEESDWATLEVSMPKNKVINTAFLYFLNNHPHIFSIFRHLLGL